MSNTVAGGLSPVRNVLSGGTVVLVQETAFSPAVTISFAFRAGTLYEPESLPGLAWFLGRVVDRGTQTRSADAIAETLDDRGVALRVSTNRHVTAISCTCLSEDFGDMLDVLSDIARHAVFPPEEMEKLRAETITAIRQDRDNPGIRAGEALQALLYRDNHPYGRPAKGTIETVERITRDDLLAHYRARFAASSLLVTVAGDVPAAAATDRVAAALDGWSARPFGEREVPPVPPAAGTRIVIDMPEKSQTDIAYGFVTVSRLDPAYYAHWVMNTILGQFGLGGRLAENIRERQG